MKSTGDFDGVGEFFRLFFILAWSIIGLLHSGGGVLVRGKFNSTDHQTMLSLTSQIQKEDSIHNLLTVFNVFYAKISLKYRFCKQHNKDLEQNPLTSTWMAYRPTSQPLEFIVDFNGKYILMLWSCHFFKLTSQGQVKYHLFGWIRINGDVRSYFCVNYI